MPLKIANISFYDSRLFPGLPILIYVVNLLVKNFYLSGYLVVLASFSGSYFLLYKMTGSKLSILALIFPPILLNLASLIDTEIPFIFLTLLGLSFLKDKKYALAFLMLGVSVWFRLVGVAVLAGIFIYLALNRRVGKFFLALPFFALPAALFLLYNYHFYGSQNLLYQIFTYQTLHPGRINMGIIQLGEDIVRAFRWHWYRILFSGLAYIALYALLWIKSIKFRSPEFWIISAIYFFILSVNLVPFLENLGRYLAPTIPLFWLIFYRRFKDERLLFLLLPLSLMVVAV